MFRPGERVGDYEIVLEISAGGMATLFRARRRGAAGFSREVAIKVVHPHLAADPEFLEMLVEEARLVARIHHPNVVRVHELAHYQSAYYLVMELIRGCSIAELLERLPADRSLSTAAAVHLAIQIADGLHAAHETRDDDGNLLGVVHRDVSPQNVLVDPTGHATLIDFGIARSAGRRRTATGTLKGKLAYMAPEQARAEDVDRRVDVYALGIVLWEMLTGRPMFTSATEVELLDEVRAPCVEPPSKHADVSPELDRVVMQALSTERDARPRTAALFRQMLMEAEPDAARVGVTELRRHMAIVPIDDSEPATARAPLPVRFPVSSRAATTPTRKRASSWRRVAAVLAVVALGSATFVFSRSEAAIEPSPERPQPLDTEAGSTEPTLPPPELVQADSVGVSPMSPLESPSSALTRVESTTRTRTVRSRPDSAPSMDERDDDRESAAGVTWIDGVPIPDEVGF